MEIRKLCTSPFHQGPRWLLWIEFYVRQWNEDKTEPIRLGSQCKCCIRIDQRYRKGIAKNGVPYQPADPSGKRTQYRRRLDKSVLNQRRRVRHRDRRDPRLPIEPFQQWLYMVVMENSIAGVARNVDVSSKRVSVLLSGRYYSAKAEKWYPIKHVRYSVVEKFCRPFGIHIHLLYHPDMIDKYRANDYSYKGKEKRRK